MSLMQAMLAEFNHETENTRKMLERVPDDRLAWKPHVKSMSLARLSAHVAEIPQWGSEILLQDQYDVASYAGKTPTDAASRKHLLELFDQSNETFRAAAGKTKDDRLMGPWRLLKGGQTVMELPRVAAARGFIFNHVIHHRGQLSVYLRQLEVPLPAIYGPSADDTGGM